jgi:large subunit ribosomal protein L15
MKLEEIMAAAGRHKRARRVGRGRGSGHGKTSSRGQKGFGARTGVDAQMGFEGGQNPTLRRIPKRGFKNTFFAKPVAIVNVCDLERSFDDGATVDAKALAELGLIRRADATVKLLGKGELKRKLTVRVDQASKAASDKVAAAGGTLALAEK